MPDKAMSVADISVFAVRTGYQPKEASCTFEVTEEDGERTITGRDHFSPKPMSPDEAAMQLDANDFEFLTFLNSENDRINVIYRRKNGNLGLIDPIF